MASTSYWEPGLNILCGTAIARSSSLWHSRVLFLPFPTLGMYDPAVLDTVRAQYHDRGWKHLVTAQSHADALNPGRTDLWIRFEHGNVEGMVLMLASPTNL